MGNVSGIRPGDGRLTEDEMSVETINKRIVELHRRGWLSNDPEQVLRLAQQLRDQYSAWDEYADLVKRAAELERRQAERV